MSDRFIIEVTNAAVIDALTEAIGRIQDPRPLLELIGATLESNLKQRFITKLDPAGQAWLPLAPQTLKRKKGVGSLLELSGHMAGNAGHNVDALSVEVGFTDFYAQYHETGTRFMPRRQLLSDDFVAGTLGQQDQDDVLADVRVYLNGLGL